MKEVEGTAVDGSPIQVELHNVPMVEPENFLDWKKGRFSVSSWVLAEGKLSSNSFAFELRDNSALPLAMRGLIAVVDPGDAEVRAPAAAKKLVAVYDQGSYLIGRYIQHGTPTIEPENKDYRPVQLSDKHIVIGVLSKLAQRSF